MNTDGLFASVTNIPIVGVAIGLMLTYLVVSLVASSVKEAVASVFQWRGTYLQHGLGALLSIGTNSKFDLGKVGNGVLNGLAANIGYWFKAHFSRADPTAAAGEAIKLAQTAIDAAKDAVAKAKVVTAAAGPADPAATAAVINARNAATNAAGALAEYTAKDTISNTSDLFAMVDNAARQAATAMTADAIAEAEKLAASAQAALAVFKVRIHPLIKGTPSSLPSYVPARDFATAMLDVLRDGSANAGLAQIKRTVGALPEGDIKRILTTFIADAGNDADKLRARIETWFDDAMDRLSGLYKRFTQYFLLALGFAIAVLLNIDSVHLAVNMWEQPALRAQIVASAIATVQPASNPQNGSNTALPPQLSPPTVQAALDKVHSLPLPIGRAACSNFFGQPPSNPPQPPPATPNCAPQPPPATCNCTPQPPPTTPNCALQPPPATPNCPPHPVYKHWGAWASWTIVGWIVTAFAISLGAPFWFGLLQNIMNLRAAGTPPARSDAKT